MVKDLLQIVEERTSMPPRSAKYSPELRKLAVRMFGEMRTKCNSDQEAIHAIADAFGVRHPEIIRKWIRQSERDGNRGDLHSSSYGFVRKSLFRQHSIIAGVAIFILGGLGLAYAELALGTDNREPQLEVDGVVLTSAKEIEQSNGLPGTTPFKIDIKLLNTGTRLAVINNARLVIQEFAQVPLRLIHAIR